MHHCNIRNNPAFAFQALSLDSLAVIDATDNWWGAADSAAIETIVYHRSDEARYPTVKFVPFATAAFDFDSPTAVEESESSVDFVPTEFVLRQNYPNPFNPSTTIEFALPHRTEISLTICDILGRSVRDLVRHTYSAGTHSVQFDGRDDRDALLPSGVYFYRLRAGNQVETGKMLLLK